MSSEAPAESHGPDDSARWPSRVIALCQEWRSATATRAQDYALAELWFLVNAAVTRYIRLHGQPYGSIEQEDVRDIASEKSMAFLQALERNTLDIESLHPAKVCSYLSMLARNGLVDRFRAQGRQRAFARDPGPLWVCSQASRLDSAEMNIQHEQFVGAICECVSHLTPRARFVWFLRAFYDMPSRAIAAHREVGMTSTAVDMLLSRTRRVLRDCMERKGFDANDAPPGAFVALWDMLRTGRKDTSRSHDE